MAFSSLSWKEKMKGHHPSSIPLLTLADSGLLLVRAQARSLWSQSQARRMLTSITGIAKAIQEAKVSPGPKEIYKGEGKLYNDQIKLYFIQHFRTVTAAFIQ